MASRLASWIAIAGLGLVLSSCAVARSVQKSVSASLGVPEARAVGESQARYSAAAGVALHRKPDASSEVVGKLALHESVLRYQRKAGFAYVTAKRSGLAGWVRERQLIERLPASTKRDTSETTPPEIPQPETESPETPPEKSIFDPY
jgi:hypothetical protein